MAHKDISSITLVDPFASPSPPPSPPSLPSNSSPPFHGSPTFNHSSFFNPFPPSDSSPPSNSSLPPSPCPPSSQHGILPTDLLEVVSSPRGVQVGTPMSETEQGKGRLLLSGSPLNKAAAYHSELQSQSLPPTLAVDLQADLTEGNLHFLRGWDEHGS
jgi:hypothetical protein